MHSGPSQATKVCSVCAGMFLPSPTTATARSSCRFSPSRHQLSNDKRLGRRTADNATTQQAASRLPVFEPTAARIPAGELLCGDHYPLGPAERHHSSLPTPRALSFVPRTIASNRNSQGLSDKAFGATGSRRTHRARQ
jgi:hypothetical protein